MIRLRSGFVRIAFIVILISSTLTVPPVLAEDEAFLKNYVVFKTGIYNPTGDLENFDTGLNIEGVFGRYFHQNFALEGGTGLFGTNATFSGTSATLGTYIEEDTLAVIPFTATAKGILPLDRLELFAGAGVGLYLTSLDGDLSTSNFGNFSISDSDLVFGLHLIAGGNFNITERFFLGIEGKYISTEDAQYEGAAFGQTFTVKGDLTGYMVNGLFGYRF